MEIITVNASNIDHEHICCAIGNDAENRLRAETKKAWMKERFAQGLVFKRFDERGKLFIEYMPGENVWKPIIAPQSLVINCLWVSGRFKGMGLSRKLLEECFADARAAGKTSIVAVSSTKVKPFLTDKKFYQKHGFEVVDNAPPYFELLQYRLTPSAPAARFTDAARTGQCPQKEGFAIYYSPQCPFMEEYTALLERLILKRGQKCTRQRLSSAEEAQRLGSPFGTLGLYYQGGFVTHELMPEGKFDAFLDGLLK